MMDGMRRRGLLAGIALSVVAATGVLAVWSPGQAQVGVIAHDASATPDAVPRSVTGEDGTVVPTVPPQGAAALTVAELAEQAEELAARDPIRRHFLHARQTVDALPAPQQTALAVARETSQAVGRDRLTPSPGPSPTRQ